MLEFLEYDEIARLSTTNKDNFEKCDNYIHHALGVSVTDLQHFTCQHVIDKKNNITCPRTDNHSIEFHYCRKHEEEHTCWDCGRQKDHLIKTNACADYECCYKFVCPQILESGYEVPGGCEQLPCSNCHEEKNIMVMSYMIPQEGNKIITCDDCLYSMDDASFYVPMIYWHGLSEEEYERRYFS
jgi:hypothetical protein